MTGFLFISTGSLVILYLFYWCFLKNELLFRFNRFFLLGSILFSLSLPFIEIPVSFDLFNTIKARDISEIHWGSSQVPFHLEAMANTDKGQSSMPEKLILAVYLIGVFIMGLRFIRNIYRILQLKDEGKKIQYLGYQVILSKLPIQTFSFVNTIFMHELHLANKEDDMIIQHEAVHLNQGHSFDVILIELLMIILWFQPMMYLFRKAIGLNHEFIADQQVLSQVNNPTDYIQKILETSSHLSQFSVASSFSFISIKKRIKMMTQKKLTKKMNAIKTGFAIVVAGGLLVTFSFSLKPNLSETKKEPFVLILDAGHGGIDTGSTSVTGVLEKDVVNSIAQKVTKKLSNENAIKVYQTRNGDKGMLLESRIKQTPDADLFLSIHGSSHTDANITFKEIYYSSENEYSAQSLNMAKTIASAMGASGEDVRLHTANYYVLENSSCPALLVNVGFFSNSVDAAFLQSNVGQEKIADGLYQAIKDVAR